MNAFLFQKDKFVTNFCCFLGYDANELCTKANLSLRETPCRHTAKMLIDIRNWFPEKMYSIWKQRIAVFGEVSGKKIPHPWYERRKPRMHIVSRKKPAGAPHQVVSIGRSTLTLVAVVLLFTKARRFTSESTSADLWQQEGVNMPAGQETLVVQWNRHTYRDAATPSFNNKMVSCLQARRRWCPMKPWNRKIHLLPHQTTSFFAPYNRTTYDNKMVSPCL